MRVRFTIRESSLGVEALHFRLPVRLQSIEDVFVVESCHAILQSGLGFSESSCLFKTNRPRLGAFLFRVPRVDIEVAWR